MFIEQYLGMISVFVGNTPPSGWMFCQGQQLPINDYEALYTIIGNTYGGGNIAFALPDMRGRVVVGAGQAPGMQAYGIGQMDGVETVVIDPGQMPPHTHQVISFTAQNQMCTGQQGETSDPTESFPAQVNGAPNAYTTTPSNTLGPSAIQPPSPPGGQGPGAIGILSPFLTIQYIICVDGIYPSPPDA